MEIDSESTVLSVFNEEIKEHNMERRSSALQFKKLLLQTDKQSWERKLSKESFDFSLFDIQETLYENCAVESTSSEILEKSRLQSFTEDMNQHGLSRDQDFQLETKSIPEGINFLLNESSYSQCLQLNARSNQSKPWSRTEEVFLVGAVFERLFRVGSLSPNKKKKTERKSSPSGAQECWNGIKDTYDQSLIKYSTKNQIEFIPRTTAALSRHYKVMKARLAKQVEMGKEEIENFKVLYFEWCLLDNARDLEETINQRHLAVSPSQKMRRRAISLCGTQCEQNDLLGNRKRKHSI